MRTILTILWILSHSSVAIADETSTTFDRCVVLNDSENQTAESKLAIYFDLPESVDETEVIYVEIEFDLTLQAPQGSSIFELRAYPLLSNWTEQSIEYDALTDSLSYGSYTISIGDQDDFHIDITEFVREIVEEERTNYGLMFDADLLGDSYIRVPANTGNAIKTNAVVNIIYK